MSHSPYENHWGSPTLTFLNVLGVLGMLNVLNVLCVLHVLHVLHLLNMLMDASLACWALFLVRQSVRLLVRGQFLACSKLQSILKRRRLHAYQVQSSRIGHCDPNNRSIKFAWCIKKNKAVYTAYFAPYRPKNNWLPSIHPTDRPREGLTGTPSYWFPSSRLKSAGMFP